MTVIAWDGKTLASDRRSVNGALVSTTTKIRRVGAWLCGGAGSLGLCMTMFAWVAGGRKPEEFPRSVTDPTGDMSWVEFLVIEEDGRACLYAGEPYGYYLDGPVTLGSGKIAARMAMHLGHSAEKAVRLTSEILSDCGDGVDTLTL